MPINDESIPQFVADGVKIQARVFACRFIAQYNDRHQLYEQLYNEAVQPYAEKVYVLEELVAQQQQYINALVTGLKSANEFLNQANDLIEKLIIK